jgi:hypothetical protein
MHNMEEDSFFGTCLMQDGRYVTLSWQHLDKALKKVLEYDYVISPTIEKLLQDLYNAAMADVLALEEQIEISECTYQQMKANATLARQAKRAARNSTSEAHVPTIARMTIYGTQDEITSDKDHSHLQLAAKLEVGKVVATRQQSRQSRRNILSLTKRRPLNNVDNKASHAEHKDIHSEDFFYGGECQSQHAGGC